jgi:hypothetical protein
MMIFARRLWRVLTALITAAMLFATSEQLRAANQTATISPIQLNSALPYRVSVEPYDFGAVSLPTVHSYAAGTVDGKWVILAGRTNGLHGFTSVAANNFPPASQNRDVWVIDPISKQSWSRSLADASSGLTLDELNSLTQTNSQFYQRGDRLYMTGGYGVESEQNGSPFYNTFDELSAIDLPGLATWAMGGAGTAKSHVRQISDPLFKITGGAMYEINGRTHLVFGHDFVGNYTNGTNGVYANQVRSFDIVDDGAALSIANVISTTPDPNFRRRDLNIVPVIRPGAGSTLDQGLLVLSGVFTPTNGAWTVPVEIDANGNPTMDDPAAPATFKQGFNGYHSAKVGLYSETTGSMHEILFGGISLQTYDTSAQQVITDNRLPFINDITSIVIDEQGNYVQHRLGEFPVLNDPLGNRLRFGANAELFLADGIETYSNGVVKLDSLASPTTVGYIFGGIASNAPNTRGIAGAATAASDLIFRVVITPVPEPDSLTPALAAFGAAAHGLRRKRPSTTSSDMP